jgi:hypothetical protein
MQFQQTCTICRDPDDLISTNVEQITTTSQLPKGRFTKGKVLPCGHAFHETCYNRFVYENINKNCPNCRAPIPLKDRCFTLSEDPCPPEGYQRFFARGEQKQETVVIDKKIPERFRQYVFQNSEKFFEPGFDGSIPGLTTISSRTVKIPRTPTGNAPVQQMSSFSSETIYYIDKEGVSHKTL